MNANNQSNGNQPPSARKVETKNKQTWEWQKLNIRVVWRGMAFWINLQNVCFRETGVPTSCFRAQSRIVNVCVCAVRWTLVRCGRALKSGINQFIAFYVQHSTILNFMAHFKFNLASAALIRLTLQQTHGTEHTHWDSSAHSAYYCLHMNDVRDDGKSCSRCRWVRSFYVKISNVNNVCKSHKHTTIPTTHTTPTVS